jgi:Calcineurin-like phosphoesterase
MVFVTSDPHGHHDVLAETLRLAGLVDESENWCGADAVLWVLGDLMDRGPDGIGVLDVVIRLQQQARDAGGEVGVLLGNHEVLATGMYRFGRQARDTERTQSLVLNWQRNGGRDSDQEALTDAHVEWLLDLPALVDLEGTLLMHSDTTEYLTYGDDIASINAGVTAALASDDVDVWWDLLSHLTDRYAFAREGGLGVAQDLMAKLGVRRMVHGHSIIADLRGIEPGDVDAALLYARRQVLAIDGGIYAGGPCLVVNLDGWPD